MPLTWIQFIHKKNSIIILNKISSEGEKKHYRPTFQQFTDRIRKFYMKLIIPTKKDTHTKR